MRKASLDSTLLRAAVKLAPAGVEIVVATIRGIPLYDGDEEAGSGIPQPARELKNAIDWLSRPPADIKRVFGGVRRRRPDQGRRAPGAGPKTQAALPGGLMPIAAQFGTMEPLRGANMKHPVRAVPHKTLTAWAVAAALLVSAPGLPCYQAIAATEAAGASMTGGSGASGIGRIGADLPANRMTPMGKVGVQAKAPGLTLERTAMESAPQRAAAQPMADGSATAGLQEAVAQIGAAEDKAGSAEKSGAGLRAALSRYWENAKGAATALVAAQAPVAQRSRDLGHASPGDHAQAEAVPAAKRSRAGISSHGRSLLSRWTAGIAAMLALPSLALAAAPGKALTLDTVANASWLLSSTGIATWIPIAGVVLAAVISLIAPKAQMVEQTYLQAELIPMPEINGDTLRQLRRKAEDSLDDHDDLVSHVIEKLGYDHVYTAGGKYVLSIPSNKTVEEAQKQLLGLGIVKTVAPIVVERPQRPIESRIATIIPVSAAIFASGLMLGSPWSGFFTALVVLGVAQHTSRYTRTLAGITIPLLMTIPSAIVGFYTDSPFAAFFHSLIVGGVFEFVARKNTFGSYFAGRPLNLDRASLLLMIGLPLAALSAFTIWIDWALAGFFGLIALCWAIESALSSATATPKDSPHIQIKFRSGSHDSPDANPK